MSGDLDSALAPPSLPEPSTSAQKRYGDDGLSIDIAPRSLTPADTSSPALALSLEKDVSTENATANTIVNAGSECLPTSSETNSLGVESDLASSTVDVEASPNKSTKMLSFFQRMGAHGAEPKSSASSASGVDENDVGPLSKATGGALSAINVDTGSQKSAKLLSFFQQLGKHAKLGPSRNSELAGAFASWVGDQGPRTLLDKLKTQPDLPLVHEQVFSILYNRFFLFVSMRNVCR